MSENIRIVGINQIIPLQRGQKRYDGGYDR